MVAAGVVFRYALDNPLQWGDEVGMAVLIAITFLGAALALYRGEHLGVSAFRNRLSDRWATLADGFVAWVVLAVSAGLTWASVPLLESVQGQTTVSGLLPASIDYAPLTVGGIAMTIFAVFHLTRIPWQALLVSGAVTAAAVALLVAWGLLWPAAPGTGVWVMLAIDGFCLVAAVPVAFALAAGSLAYIAATGTLPLVAFSEQMQSGVGNFVLLSIPVFRARRPGDGHQRHVGPAGRVPGHGAGPGARRAERGDDRGDGGVLRPLGLQKRRCGRGGLDHAAGDARDGLRRE